MEKGSEYRTHRRVNYGAGTLPEVATAGQLVPTHLDRNRIRSIRVATVELRQPFRSAQRIVLGFALALAHWHRLSRSPEPFEEHDRAFQNCASNIRNQIKWRLNGRPITVINVTATNPKEMIQITAPQARVPTQEDGIGPGRQDLMSQVSGSLDSRFGRVQAAVNEKDESIGVVGSGTSQRCICSQQKFGLWAD